MLNEQGATTALTSKGSGQGRARNTDWLASYEIRSQLLQKTIGGIDARTSPIIPYKGLMSETGAEAVISIAPREESAFASKRSNNRRWASEHQPMMICRASCI